MIIYGDDWCKARVVRVANLVAAASDDEFIQRDASRLAYYVIFQLISLFCTQNLLGVQHINENDWARIFRLLEHKELKTKLKNQETHKLHPELKSLGISFETLQKNRFLADYDPLPFKQNWDLLDAEFSKALDVIGFINKLSQSQKTTLAIHLLFKDKA
jgi:hypothetical protein